MIRTTGKTTQMFLASVAITAMLMSGCNQTASVVMNRSGQGFYKMGHYAGAAHEFRQALVSDPNNADYAANLAMALQKSGDTGGAEKMYRRALTANPGHQGAYREYSRMLANQNRPGEALALMEQYVGTEGYRVEPHLQLAELQRELGNRTGEVHALQQALKINPQHPTALAGLGTYFQDLGQTQTAMKMYERSLQANSAQPEVYSRYAALQGRAQQKQQAQATLARLQQQHQRTAHAIQSYQQQLGPRVAAVPPSGTMQVAQAPQPNYAVQQSNVSQYQMSFVPEQVTNALPVPSNYSSEGMMSYSESPVATQGSGPYFSDSQATYSGTYEVSETAGIPTELNSTILPSTTASVADGSVVGPEIGFSPTRVSTAIPNTVRPQTVVPSRVRNQDHNHSHGTHPHNHDDVSAPEFDDTSVAPPSVRSAEVASDRLIFDDGDILGDSDVWDPVKSTTPVSVD